MEIRVSRQIWGLTVLPSRCQPGAHVNPQGDAFSSCLDKAIYVASLLLFREAALGRHPALLWGLQKQGLPQVGEAQILGPGMEGGSCWQGVTAFSCSWEVQPLFPGKPGSSAAKFVDWRSNQPFWAYQY